MIMNILMFLIVKNSIKSFFFIFHIYHCTIYIEKIQYECTIFKFLCSSNYNLKNKKITSNFDVFPRFIWNLYETALKENSCV